MAKASFSRLMNGGVFSKNVALEPDLRAERTIRIDRPDREKIEGRMEARRDGKPASTALSGRLSKRLAIKSHFGFSDGVGSGYAHDPRQRAVVKIHYFNHAGGGGAGLTRHASYVAREAAGKNGRVEAEREHAQTPPTRGEIDPHAQYIARGRDMGPARPFYDAISEQIDGAARTGRWAERDRRHFRVILAAEHGEALRDLPAYTREVMARAEAQLGTRLEWVAVDHWDTDNPHTHIIIRGRRVDGRDLILPRAFVQHDLRSISRDVATEWLGRRTPAQERAALDKEARRHAPTRLDRMIADQLPENGVVRIASLSAPNGDPTLTRSLKARMQELARLGLAHPVRHNVMALSPDWQQRLSAMELHLDIRKRVMRDRSLQQTAKRAQKALKLAKGVDLGPGLER